MSKKLSDDIMKSNTEYVKLRSNTPSGNSPRENPDHQSPGSRGLDRPDLEQWTTLELRRAVGTLKSDAVDDMSRGELIEHLIAAGRRPAGKE